MALILLEFNENNNQIHPIPMRGKAIFVILNSNQIVHKTISHIGQAIFIHKITDTALYKSNIPAHTKAKTIRETTLLLCNRTVVENQVKIHFIILLTDFFSLCFNDLEIIFLMASSKTYIPKRNNQSPPNNNQ